MSCTNKVVWSEGMFLVPQHFQQFDRYWDSHVKDRVFGMRPYDSGLRDIVIDQSHLNQGKFAIESISGIFPDGSVFNCPNTAWLPEPIQLDESIKNTKVYLVIPSVHETVDTDYTQEKGAHKRYMRFDREIDDSNNHVEKKITIEVAKLNVKLLLESQLDNHMVTLPIAIIQEVDSNGHVILDEGFIPPYLDVKNNSQLNAMLSEVHSLLKHRGETLASRLSQYEKNRVAEFDDLILLQLINRFEPQLTHLLSLPQLHPVEMYQAFVMLAGEISTVTMPSKRPGEYPVYKHLQLKESFQPVIDSIRSSFSTVLEQKAVQLNLVQQKYGIYVAAVPDRQLLDTATFILGVRAKLPPELLQTRFPAQTKIGPVEKIRELVNLSLPGIGLRNLPVAPRQIPYLPEMLYFELTRLGPLWETLKKSGGFAFHVSGEYPSIELAFWAIKE